jgi:hypothetical protein
MADAALRDTAGGRRGMSAALAFTGTFLLSLFVALLAALQLADYFGANEELILVLMTLPVFAFVSLLAFLVVNAVAKRPSAFHWIALLLALLALSPLALPILVQMIADRSTNPFTFGIENTAIVIELIVPALIAVLVQWGLVRRRWLRIRGEDDLSRWPWVTTIVAGLVILNPVGLDILGQAITYRASNWMRELMRTVALCSAAALIAMTLIEYYVRGRMLRRRSVPSL